MNKHQQSGMTTLLITSMLLIVALLFSLASYKNLFYQIKRTQNEVLARQAHWAAEGGLECGFAQIQKAGNISDAILTDCNNGQELTLSTDNGKSVLTSETDNKYKKIAKTIVAGGARSSGVIKSSADLYFNGDHQYFPDPNMKISENGWACSLLRYKRSLYIHNKSWSKLSNVGFNDKYKPSNDFIIGSNICDNEYKTEYSLINKVFKKDVVNEVDMDLFKETFSTKRKDWKLVRDGNVFINFKIKKPNDCGNEIAGKISKDNRYIWATGDCFIDQLGLDALSKKSTEAEGVFVLLHNGILSITGTSDSYKGIIYHFKDNIEYIDTTSSWNSAPKVVQDIVFSNDMYAASNADLDPNTMKKMMFFYMVGAFTPNGGFIFDTPNQLSYFNLSLKMSYNGDLLNDLLAPFGKPTWQQGSWHDF